MADDNTSYNRTQSINFFLQEKQIDALTWAEIFMFIFIFDSFVLDKICENLFLRQHDNSDVSTFKSLYNLMHNHPRTAKQFVFVSVKMGTWCKNEIRASLLFPRTLSHLCFGNIHEWTIILFLKVVRSSENFLFFLPVIFPSPYFFHVTKSKVQKIARSHNPKGWFSAPEWPELTLVTHTKVLRANII